MRKNSINSCVIYAIMLYFVVRKEVGIRHVHQNTDKNIQRSEERRVGKEC